MTTFHFAAAVYPRVGTVVPYLIPSHSDSDKKIAVLLKTFLPRIIYKMIKQGKKINNKEKGMMQIVRNTCYLQCKGQHFAKLMKLRRIYNRRDAKYIIREV